MDCGAFLFQSCRISRSTRDQTEESLVTQARLIVEANVRSGTSAKLKQAGPHLFCQGWDELDSITSKDWTVILPLYAHRRSKLLEAT